MTSRQKVVVGLCLVLSACLTTVSTVKPTGKTNKPPVTPAPTTAQPSNNVTTTTASTTTTAQPPNNDTSVTTTTTTTARAGSSPAESVTPVNENSTVSGNVDLSEGTSDLTQHTTSSEGSTDTFIVTSEWTSAAVLFSTEARDSSTSHGPSTVSTRVIGSTDRPSTDSSDTSLSATQPTRDEHTSNEETLTSAGDGSSTSSFTLHLTSTSEDMRSFMNTLQDTVSTASVAGSSSTVEADQETSRFVTTATVTSSTPPNITSTIPTFAQNSESSNSNEIDSETTQHQTTELQTSTTHISTTTAIRNKLTRDSTSSELATNAHDSEASFESTAMSASIVELSNGSDAGCEAIVTSPSIDIKPASSQSSPATIATSAGETTTTTPEYTTSKATTYTSADQILLSSSTSSLSLSTVTATSEYTTSATTTTTEQISSASSFSTTSTALKYTVTIMIWVQIGHFGPIPF